MCYVSYVMVFKREKEVVSFFVCFLCLSNSSYHTISTVLKVWPETKTFSMNNTIKIFHNNLFPIPILLIITQYVNNNTIY